MRNLNTTTGWAPEPTGRGTIGLLYSCFATIFICTWSATHSDVLHGGSWLSKMESRLGDVVMGLVAPEWTTYVALCEFERVRGVREKTPNWSLRQCFFLTMDGLLIRYHKPDKYDRQYKHATPNQLLALFTSGTLPWPSISDSEIDDHATSNALIKAIALLQITYFTAQAIARTEAGLPVTPLELFTLSTVLCAVLSYVAWWHKPYGVTVPIYIHTEGPVQIPDEFNHEAREEEGNPFPYSRVSMLSAVVLCLGSAAILSAAWKYMFPSAVEMWIWRVAAIACPALSLGMMWVTFKEKGPWQKGAGKDREAGQRRMPKWLYVSVPVLYMVLRLYLLVEVFACLRKVPGGVYGTVQWTQYFPVFG